MRLVLDRSMALVTGQTLALLLTCVGCSGGGAPPSAAPDARPSIDAEQPDDRGVAIDAETEDDVGVADSSVADGSMAELDMRGPDAAPAPDAGLPDAAAPDLAGPDLDAPDMAEQDMADPDMAAADMAEADASAPAANAVVGGPGVLSGGGAVSTERYRLRLSVDGPSPAAKVGSPMYEVRLGVGAPQLPSPERPPGRQP